MADFIAPVFDILTCLCGYCTKWVGSIRKLGESLNSLRNASNQLNSMYLDVLMKVETAQQDPDPDLMVLNVVKDWIVKVEDLQNEVLAILQRGDQAMQANCLGGCCPKNCRARYKLHKMVTQKLSGVNDLISKGNFDVVAEKLARDRFDERPVDKIVGAESTFEELYADPRKIQEDVRKKLRVQDDIWDSKVVDDRALLLYNILKKKKFVLLLDDLWERIDLLKLGVPSPNNHECKIIFTTRLEEVCGLMDAQRCIRVNCLTPDKAFALFKEKVGETIIEDPQILRLAKQVVEECQGLPLALCTVGCAMANKVTPNEWKRAVEILRSHPSRVSGMVDNVYHMLEFSYDRLPSNTYKSCLLYCALFLEDYDIEKEELILLWKAEGFFDEFNDNIHEARKQGEDTISSLKYACLLENGDERDTIKMHDVIRDMALWIACDHGKRTRFFVKDCPMTKGLEAYNHVKWKEVERLFLWGQGEITQNFSQNPRCPNLATMLMRDTLVQDFPTEVFVIPSTVRVLDLSCNRHLKNLPLAIGDFVNLEHMNLSYTGITKLVEELKYLKKLRHFLLDGIVGELEFPKEVISNLSSLQFFSLIDYAIPVSVEENMLLDELEGLDHLQDIRIHIESHSSFKKILISSKLQRCMSYLEVNCNIDASSLHDLFSSIGKMDHLEILYVCNHILLEDSEAANIPRGLFFGHEYIIVLRELCIEECEIIFDLNWLIHAPNLEILDLSNCDSLVEVITEDFENVDSGGVKSNLFSNLTQLRLENLSNLRSICRMPLQFPCLKDIEVEGCPNLKKLPFNSQSALKNLKTFEGERDWLDQLQWEDEATKQLLLSKFEE